MDPETSTTATPTPQPISDSNQKKCKHLPIIIILTIIAVVGIGLGGFEFYQNTLKNSEIDSLKGQLVKGNDNDTATGDVANLPSVKDAEKMLENYTGVGLKTGTFLNAYYDVFASNFDDNVRAFLAYSGIEDNQKSTNACASEVYEKGQCTTKGIGYDLINQKYQSLFGASANMKKENYAFHNFFYLVYNSATNSYDEYILQAGGISPIFALHKVVSTKSASDGFIATVSFMKMNLDVELTDSFSAGATVRIKDQTVDDAINSMAIYEFKFVKNGDTYVLNNVANLGNK